MHNEVEHHTSLDATLREIMEMMARHEVVSQLVAREKTNKQELVQALVARQHAVELETRLNRLHPADAAFVLESLPGDQRETAWQLIRKERRGTILLELAASVRASLVALLEDDELLALGKQMQSTDFADLIENLPEERARRVLAHLDTGERQQVQTALSFPPDSVGALMEMDVVTVRGDLTLEEAISSLRGRRGLPEPLTSISVVDRVNALQGVLPLARLLFSDAGLKVADVMDGDPVHFSTTDPADEAAQAFERYDLISAPVVNLHRQVVGWVTVDRVLDQLKEDSFKQSLSQVGLSDDVDLFGPIWQSGRKRWIWLGLNLFTAFIASRVIGFFEGSIAQLAALAALMPIVASIGGNTGNQTVALVIRGLALSQLNASNRRFLLRKELAISGLNGALWGLLMAFVTLLLYQSLALAGVMAIAMLLNMLVAAAVGVLCPLLLERLGRDPVMGSSILLTAITDSMGFLIFLGLASAVLL
ncbi:MAG: magnesium transporter [Steroidobacteraceae bacterium]